MKKKKNKLRKKVMSSSAMSMRMNWISRCGKVMTTKKRKSKMKKINLKTSRIGKRKISNSKRRISHKVKRMTERKKKKRRKRSREILITSSRLRDKKRKMKSM